MSRLAVRPLLAALGFAFAMPVAADGLAAVEIRGLEGDAFEDARENVRSMVSLIQLDPERRAAITDSRIGYLVRRTPGQVRRALQPYGYYNPAIDIRVEPGATGATVVVEIDPGEPVVVTARELLMRGAAEDDATVTDAVAAFEPKVGEVFDHRRYEAGKGRVERALREHGYFDAVTDTARVEVLRAERSADIAVAWDSGPRHRFGEVEFGEHPFRPQLLHKVVRFEPGEPYDQNKLIALQRSLTELDYFAVVDVQPQPEAREDDLVPIRVGLTPAKRNIYSAGVSYGTDTGAGVNAGWERRWINRRGHKSLLRLDATQRRQLFTAQYRVPAFAWVDGWYTAALNVLGEEFDGLESERAELVASRTGRLGLWNLTAAVHAQRERFGPPGMLGNYSSLIYPSLRAQASSADDPLYPRNGWSLIGEIKAGPAALGSDIEFAQIYAQGRYVRGLGERGRLLLRAEAGATHTDQFERFPPSLRFYAGGDRSVRGYGYREIGPRRDDIVFGGRHLLVGSIEYERLFRDNWAWAVFVDSGDAFDGSSVFEARTGVGIGLRWRSPVGPVRIDLAHGLDNRDESFRIHFSLGPDL